jgi:hypothetical protein
VSHVNTLILAPPSYSVSQGLRGNKNLVKMNKAKPSKKQHAYALKKRKEKLDAFEKLGDNPSLEQINDAVVDGAMAELEERVNDVVDSWETESLFEDAFAELDAHGTEVVDEGELSTPPKIPPVCLCFRPGGCILATYCC